MHENYLDPLAYVTFNFPFFFNCGPWYGTRPLRGLYLSLCTSVSEIYKYQPCLIYQFQQSNKSTKNTRVDGRIYIFQPIKNQRAQK